jgi:hypothetical protein
MTADENIDQRQKSFGRTIARSSRARSLRAVACGAMILCGLAMMLGGSLARYDATRWFVSMPAIEGATEQQTVRTVSDVTVLLGGLLLCTGMLTGAKLLARPVERIKHRTVQPAPANERPFAERLTRYLDEDPTPARQAKFGSARSFLLRFVPGPRNQPKPPSLIREILMRIHTLLRCER